MTKKTPDFFEVLGVPRTASIKEIKSAYRKIAMKIHPDRNPEGSTVEFSAATEAYEVLSDPKKKRDYIEQTFQNISDPRGFVENFWEAALS